MSHIFTKQELDDLMESKKENKTKKMARVTYPLRAAAADAHDWTIGHNSPEDSKKAIIHHKRAAELAAMAHGHPDVIKFHRKMAALHAQKDPDLEEANEVLTNHHSDYVDYDPEEDKPSKFHLHKRP